MLPEFIELEGASLIKVRWYDLIVIQCGFNNNNMGIVNYRV